MFHTESCQLTAQFAADTTGRSRDHHHLTRKIRRNLSRVYPDLLSSQQILYPDLPDNRLFRPVTQHVYRRGNQVLYPVLLAKTDQPVFLPASLLVRAGLLSSI